MNIVLNTQIIKFGLVGLIGMGIDFSVTGFSKEKLYLDKYIANSFGFCVAVIFNFVLNRAWTFGMADTLFATQIIKFTVVSLLGLLIKNALVYCFTRYTKNHFYLLKLAAIGIVFFWNYFANAIFTFT